MSRGFYSSDTLRFCALETPLSIHVNPNRQAALLVVLLLFGAALRCYGLDEKIIWHDEVATRVLSGGATLAAQMKSLYSAQVLTVAQVLQFQQVQQASPVLALLTDLAQHDPQHPPLYYVLANGWVQLWGDSVFALRGLSVFFGVLGLPALYWLMRELAATRRGATLAVLLLCVSPLMILYSQEAREYALWALTLLLSSAALLRALRLSGSRSAWLLYVCCTLLAVYTSLSTASLILVQVAYVLVVTRVQWSYRLSGFFVSMCTVGLLFLPWVVNLLLNFEAFRASMAWSSVIVIPRTAVVRILSLNFSRNVFDFWPEVQQDQWPPIAACTTCLLVIIASVAWVLKRTPRETRLYLVLLLVLPTALLLLPDLLFGGIRSTNARYLMPVWLGLLAALALALDQGFARAGRAKVVAGLGLVCLVGLAMATNILHAQQAAPWTKSLSISLPEVARVINQSEHPLVVGNQERHHPGNLFALANMLRPETKMQFVPIALEASWFLPAHQAAVYLYSPTEQFRRAFEKNNHVTTKLVVEDLFLQLWKVED
ncbi:MAG: hypothetical protein CK528_14275 [Alcaligenaceae bacterium]|nr:MAG: hypothetical protein CK528_14275 [Alcaligenaceae bacterium]